MDKRTKPYRYLHAINHLSGAYQYMRDRDFLLFSSGNKPAVDLRIDKTECEREILKIIKINAEMILGRKLYLESYQMNGGEKGLILSKKPMKKGKKTIREVGEILGIPECCINKYVEEDDGKGFSLISAIRYLEQIRKLGWQKDPFEVHVSANSGALGFGFVPCSPKCKEAMKIVNTYEKIKRKFNA